MGCVSVLANPYKRRLGTNSPLLQQPQRRRSGAESLNKIP